MSSLRVFSPWTQDASPSQLVDVFTNQETQPRFGAEFLLGFITEA